MHGITRRGLVLALLVSLTACANGTKTSTPAGDGNEITRDQIIAGSYQSAYDVVKRLHPNWLVKHSSGSAQVPVDIIVFLDGTRYGTLDQLRNISAPSVSTIKRIDPATATMRWGTGYGEGVLYVTSLGH